jgi:uncharacterized protein (TIGR00255 family)
MTGYGRAEASFEEWSWVWEARSVNGKNLDMRLRLPPGFESLDPKIRKQVSSKLGRGNLQISLNIQSSQGGGSFSVNESWLDTLIEKGAGLVDQGKAEKPRLDGLYMVRGVITDELQSASDPALIDRNNAILANLDVMLESLVTARNDEGRATAEMLATCLSQFVQLTHKARTCEGSQADQLKQRFDDKFAQLLSEKLPDERLATEAALLAVKADVREELDRLDAHIAQANLLLKAAGPVGRKLDFLSQEFIREINTMCSKSTDIELTQIGLEMKSLIEQFREQAANVE